MKKGYRIEHGALHFDAPVRSLHGEFPPDGSPAFVLAITDEGTVRVPWNEIPVMPCPPVLFLESGGDDAELQ